MPAFSLKPSKSTRPPFSLDVALTSAPVASCRTFVKLSSEYTVNSAPDKPDLSLSTPTLVNLKPPRSVVAEPVLAFKLLDARSTTPLLFDTLQPSASGVPTSMLLKPAYSTVVSPVSLVCCLGCVESTITYRPGLGMVSVMVLFVSSTFTCSAASALTVAPGCSAYLRISISFLVLASQFIGSPS